MTTTRTFWSSGARGVTGGAARGPLVVAAAVAGIGAAACYGTADYVGETGLVPGRYRVSARLLPIRRDGVLVDRVVALLFDPEAEGAGWATLQTG